MSRFLTEEVAQKAIGKYFEEMFQHVLKTGKKGFHAIVLDTCIRTVGSFPEFGEFGQEAASRYAFDHSLAEESCNEDEWDGSDYKKIARGKALLSFREKTNSGDVPRHMLRSGDVKWRGGVYYNGIVVAVSGFTSADDEAFSLKIAQECERLATEAYDEWHQANPRQSFV